MYEGSKCGCVVKIGVALGLASGLFTLIAGLIAAFSGYGLPMISLMGTLYIGYAPTVLGSIIGAIWSFVHTFIFIMVAGGFYCLISRCCSKSKCGTGCHSDKSNDIPKM